MREAIEKAVRGNKGVAEREHKCTQKDRNDTVEGLSIKTLVHLLFKKKKSTRTELKAQKYTVLHQKYCLWFSCPFICSAAKCE